MLTSVSCKRQDRPISGIREDNSIQVFSCHTQTPYPKLEGTRFTEAKHAQQNSPFRYLLKPKAGGIAFVLDAMGEQLKSIVNVTIHYPGGRPGYWDLLCGNVRDVVVVFEELEIPAEFIGKNYDQDPAYKLAFQSWINQLWEDKDRLLEQLHREYPVQ